MQDLLAEIGRLTGRKTSRKESEVDGIYSLESVEDESKVTSVAEKLLERVKDREGLASSLKTA